MDETTLTSPYIVSMLFGAVVSFVLFLLIWFLPKKLYKELLRPYHHLFVLIGVWLLNDCFRKLINLLVWVELLPLWALVLSTWLSTMIGCAAIGFFIPLFRNMGILNYMEELRIEATEKLKAIFRSTPDAIITTDDEGNVVDWNQSAQRIFGYTEKEIQKQNITAIMPPEYRGRHLTGMKRFNETGMPRMIGKTMTLEGLRKNGEVFPIEVSLSSFVAHKNRYFTAIIRDITSRRNLEKENLNLKLSIHETETT